MKKKKKSNLNWTEFSCPYELKLQKNKKLKPKDGKRKLYFTKDMQNFISYDLELKTACRSIFEINKNLINSKLTQINNNTKIDINNYDFFFIYLKGIKKTRASLQIKIKLNWDFYISQFKINIHYLKVNISENEKNIIEDSLICENLLKNKEKKNILFSF